MKENYTHTLTHTLTHNTHILAQTNKPAHAALMVGIDSLIERGTEGRELQREGERGSTGGVMEVS